MNTHFGSFIAEGLDLRAPAMNIVKTCFVGDIVEQQKSRRPTIIGRSDGSIPFLPRGIPYLCIHGYLRTVGCVLNF